MFSTVEVQYSGEPAKLLGGPLGDANFTLVQVHFHWGAPGQDGSEHSVSGVL